jgi:CBS domain containing-hemolysin-like protein
LVAASAAVCELSNKGVPLEHISTTTLIVTLIVMVVISAYFSGSETGMMTLNRYRLRHMAKQGNRQAR